MRIAIIPARGGSKRIANKNINSFLGVPIIGRVIGNLRDSGIFDRIIVSTDSAEIARVSKEFSAEVPFIRPKELSGDYVGTTEVIAHAIETLQLHHETDIQVCCVYPTAVLMNSIDLLASLKLLQDQKWQYVFAATQPSSSPYRSFKKSPLGGVDMLFPNYWGSRSQDLPESFVDIGFFYWATAWSWLKAEPIFGTNSTFIEIPEIRAIDINTESDWLRAEAIFELISSGKMKESKVETFPHIITNTQPKDTNE
jgi:pseudaminic acid cytidylyltransferase